MRRIDGLLIIIPFHYVRMSASLFPHSFILSREYSLVNQIKTAIPISNMMAPE